MMAVLSMEVILGSLTFTGSLMAAGKLQELLPQRPITYQGTESRQSRHARRRRSLSPSCWCSTLRTCIFSRSSSSFP